MDTNELPRRVLVVLANNTMRQVWLGERAMTGATVDATSFIVTLKNGDAEFGLLIDAMERNNFPDWFQINWIDDVDLTRCHPLPSPRLSQELDILKAAGRIRRTQGA